MASSEKQNRNYAFLQKPFLLLKIYSHKTKIFKSFL